MTKDKADEPKIQSLYDIFETNTTLESNGIWIDYGDAGKFLISRANASNTKYKRSVEAKTKPYRRQIETGTLPDGVDGRIMREVFVDSIIKDWHGVVDRSGKALDFNKENAIQLFTDLPELLTDLTEQATKLSNFTAEDVDGDIKN